MPIDNDGVMIILSSPSGAGKTTLVNLLAKLDNFEISISHTTRKPRPNEVPNKDYFFVNEDEFKRLIKNQEFLEYAKVFNNFYGSTRTPVINNLDNGKNVLFDIDWQGADQIKNKRLDYKLIAEERMKQFEHDVLHWINYDYVVINNNLDNCYEKIYNLIQAEIKAGSKDYDKDFIRNHVEKLTS